MGPNVGATCGTQTAVSHCLGLGWGLGLFRYWACNLGYWD
ncbi:hypothetical protein ES332_D11G399900v1 [Gossypium tomentosum]|uniref:Uncharacterized protein n=1 Tax=Gossypium tomentosum TaxID=34277 RepID=A0A5D2IXF7_GOSTO|nr:hypothetical protein ES332_D11G399900v1 [Gossypium tomentosum]